jgi:hypothetical protein
MKLMARKIGIRDHEMGYKFPSDASKRCRNRMVKQLRAKEKVEIRKIICE